MCASQDEGRTIVSTGAERSLTYWDLRSRDGIVAKIPTKCTFDTIDLSSNNLWIAAGGTNQNLHLYDFRQRKMITEETGHSDVIRSVKFDPDDKHIISVGDDHAICMWNVFDLSGEA